MMVGSTCLILSEHGVLLHGKYGKSTKTSAEDPQLYAARLESLKVRC